MTAPVQATLSAEINISELRSAPGPAHVPAYWIKVTANPTGAFTVTNSRNNFSKTYNAR